ncbi:MAG: hypothetical protein ACJAVA_000368 [Flavobacteriaceae bacterium]|jgi:hypothetical protein
MAYKAKDQYFFPSVEGNVKTTGKSLTLGVGEIAFVDISKTTKDGVKVLNEFTTLSPTSKLAIRMGEPGENVSRSEDNKPISTIPFKLKDVANIYVDAPERAGILVDDFIIGYNGEAGSEIELENSENEVIEMTLKGDLMGMIGLPARKYTATVGLTAPSEGVKNTDWTMHEIIENAYLDLKNYKLPGNIPITEYVDIMLVNSENPSTIPGTASTFYSLVIVDEGTYSDLGKVQAQYPELDVKKLKWESGKTTYSVIGTSLPAAYQAKADFILKGCDTCPSGYTTITQGAVYEVVIEDLDGDTLAEQLAKVQALPGATASTAVLNATDGDINTYSVVLGDLLTEGEVATFITANETASIDLISEDVTDLCKTAVPATSVWVAGESCNSTTEAYSITLKDNKCGDSRLTELQEAYPNLTVTETSAANCQRVYATTVNTNLVCSECAPIFRDVFESEAPSIYDNVSWKKAAKVYSATAKMGIRVKGKEAKIGGGELMRDDMIFFNGSVEISLVGGYKNYTNESYLFGTNDRFTVKYFSRKADAQNLGGNLRKYEEEAQIHFRGRARYEGNNYGKLVNGQETRLNAFDQYIIYSVTIAPHKIDSNFQQPQNGAVTYHFILPLGKQEAFEGIVNKLASAAGLPQVQAVSK